LCESENMQSQGIGLLITKLNLKQNGHSQSSNVIQSHFGDSEKLMRDVLKCNNFRLIYESSEDYSDRKKRKSPFLTTTLQRINSREYPHKLYIANN